MSDPEPNELDPDAMLVDAAWGSDIDAFDHALKLGARLSARDEIGNSVCSAAVCSGMEMLRHAIDRGADVNELNEDDRTALSVAVMHEKGEAVEFLLSQGAHPRFERKSMETALHQSIEKGLTEIALRILKVCEPEDLAVTNYLGRTPLILAVILGNVELVTAILAKGARIHMPTEGTRETALHFASEGRSVEIVDILMLAGADADARNIWGGSPRDYAARRNDARGIEIRIRLSRRSE